MRSSIAVVLLSAAMLCSGTADAIEDFVAPRSLALGNSLRADAAGALGPMLNPASMSFQHNYNLELIYGFRVQDLGSNLNVSIVDSVTSKVSAGLFYTYLHEQPKFDLACGVLCRGGVVTGNAVHEASETGLALSLPLGDHFAFGLTTKYVHTATNVANPDFDQTTNPGVPQSFGLDSSTSSAATADGFTVDAGIHIRVGDVFNIALVGYNLIPLHSFDAPLSAAIGLALKPISGLTFAFDTVVDFDKYHCVNITTMDICPSPPNNGSEKLLITARVGGGVEYVIGGKVPIRIGAFDDTGRPATYLSTGVGYTGQSFAIDLSYRQEVKGGNEALLIAGMRYFVDSL